MDSTTIIIKEYTFYNTHSTEEHIKLVDPTDPTALYIENAQCKITGIYLEGHGKVIDSADGASTTFADEPVYQLTIADDLSLF